jgi:hypothetical protein
MISSNLKFHQKIDWFYRNIAVLKKSINGFTDKHLSCHPGLEPGSRQLFD